MIISSFITKYITIQFQHLELMNDFIFIDEDKAEIKMNHPEKPQLIANLHNYYTSVPNKQIDQINSINNVGINEVDSHLFPDNINNNVNNSGAAAIIAISQMNRGRLIKRSLSFKDAVFHKCCYKNSSINYELDSFSKIVKSKISTEGILKLFQEI